jgi:hypothetical protein
LEGTTMAVQRLTYLDLPAAKRRTSSQLAILKLQEHLNNPVLSAEEAAKIRTRIEHITQWMNGTLPTNSEGT